MTEKKIEWTDWEWWWRWRCVVAVCLPIWLNQCLYLWKYSHVLITRTFRNVSHNKWASNTATAAVHTQNNTTARSRGKSRSPPDTKSFDSWPDKPRRRKRQTLTRKAWPRIFCIKDCIVYTLQYERMMDRPQPEQRELGNSTAGKSRKKSTAR